MPSGRTHDRITLWSLPLLAGTAFERTRSGELTLLVVTGFLVGGLMLGPDLDIHSRQYLRWGCLRWIWIPYRRSMRHRSFFSHGPLIGTVLRLGYLAVWLSLFGLLVLVSGTIAGQALGKIDHWQTLVGIILNDTITTLRQGLEHYPKELLMLCLGLELGALSHSLSDMLVSRYKRVKTYGLRGLWLRRMKRQRLPSQPYKISEADDNSDHEADRGDESAQANTFQDVPDRSLQWNQPIYSALSQPNPTARSVPSPSPQRQLRREPQLPQFPPLRQPDWDEEEF
ncbi:MAG: DUF2227 family putative metal-binding protein [Scytolyngbya sp. HA4215-MV1]|nr:DUF2227 family putative metal-binding protein [Scytolyngbya sp. HA4215-MV1]